MSVADPTIAFECPRCSRVSRVPASFAGKQGKCPGCRAMIEVPDPSKEPPPPPALPVDALAFDGAPTVAVAPGALAPVTPPAPDPALVKAMGADQRPCPSCNQPIRQAAVKCRHCGDVFDKPCPLCGETIKATAKKCRHCGEFLDQDLRHQRRRGLEEGVYHAAPGSRLAAYLLDEWVLNLPALVGFIAFIGFSSSSDETAAAISAAVFLGWFWGLTFVQWYRVATTGQTIAKRWLKIKIERLDGSPCGFLHGVVLRNWIYSVIASPVLSWIAMFIRIIDGALIFGAERRSMRDYLASTRVVDVLADGVGRRQTP